MIMRHDSKIRLAALCRPNSDIFCGGKKTNTEHLYLVHDLVLGLGHIGLVSIYLLTYYVAEATTLCKM